MVDHVDRTTGTLENNKQFMQKQKQKTNAKKIYGNMDLQREGRRKH